MQTELPKDMHPNKEVWELLGFQFSETGKNFYIASLPEGWTLAEDDKTPKFFVHIFDQYGRQRGSISQMSNEMHLCPRYNAVSYVDNKNSRVENVYFKDLYTGACLYFAGGVLRKKDATTEESNIVWNEIVKLKAIARAWGDVNFPGWQAGDDFSVDSYIAYWDVDVNNKKQSL